MGTRSVIAYQDGGKIHSIYCHWDGYPSHNGRILLEHYNSLEKAKALVALGDLSSLDERCDKPEGHTYSTRVKGYTVAYHRDRGDVWEDNSPNEYGSEIEFRMSGDYDWCEWVYLFKDGAWFYKPFKAKAWWPLTQERCMEKST